MNAQPLALGEPSIPPVVVPPVKWLDVLPPAADCLRDYQRDQIADIAAALHAGQRRILAQAPTGAGKTHIMAAIVMAASLVGLRILLLATRTRLVSQIHERLDAFDVRHAVIAASLPALRNYSARIQIASVDTLFRRALADQRMPMPSADLVIMDEAHLATAETRMRVLNHYPDAIRLGFTATPARKSGKSLGAAFDCLIPGPSVSELTASGMLVPTRIFNTPCVSHSELRALPKDSDNDFAASALGELFARPKLIGDVVSNWLRIANGKRTICFAVNKPHAAALLDSFRREGIAAEMLTDDDDETTREEVIGRLEAGNTKVVINCFLLSYGIDIPTAECIILARPTRSLIMFLQMVGRGLRSAPGKTDCIVIDHGRVVESLGLPQTNYAWTLDIARNVNSDVLKATSRRSFIEKMRTCGQCAAIWLTSQGGNACPECGWLHPPRSKAIEVQDADLEELADPEELVTPNDVRVICFFREACGWHAKRRPERWKENPKKCRWAAWCETRAKFRLAESVPMPNLYWQLEPFAASAAVSGWLQHRVIKFARGRAKARAA